MQRASAIGWGWLGWDVNRNNCRTQAEEIRRNIKRSSCTVPGDEACKRGCEPGRTAKTAVEQTHQKENISRTQKYAKVQKGAWTWACLVHHWFSSCFIMIIVINGYQWLTMVNHHLLMTACFLAKVMVHQRNVAVARGLQGSVSSRQGPSDSTLV